MKRSYLYSFVVLSYLIATQTVADPPKVARHDPKTCSAEIASLEAKVRELRREKVQLEKDNQRLLATISRIRSENKEVRQQLETARGRGTDETAEIEEAIRSGKLAKSMTLDEAKRALKEYSGPFMESDSSEGTVYRWEKFGPDSTTYADGHSEVSGRYIYATLEKGKLVSWYTESKSIRAGGRLIERGGP